MTPMVYAQNDNQSAESATWMPSFSEDITPVPPNDNYPESDDAIAACL